MIDAVRWQATGNCPIPGKVRLIDQTLLPEQLSYVEIDDLDEMVDAIKRLVVRGAPAIGIAAAFGLTASMQNTAATEREPYLAELQRNADCLERARPTAVNLHWALKRCVEAANSCPADATPVALTERLWIEADAILREDIDMCRRIGELGATLFAEANGVMTHCNAGALATGDYGTALAPIYCAFEQGLAPHVYANETRPLLQGSRLTAWELQRAGVAVTTCCDNMAAQLMGTGKVDLVIVGADRIAMNGDTANKIGTYGVAIMAQYHNIPFYVAAPYSTIDPQALTGDDIPIEQRKGDEVSHGFGKQTAPADVDIYNPAFDVTPQHLISGIVTEKEILRPPYTSSIANFLKTRSA